MAPNNDVSVDDGPRIRSCSLNIIQGGAEPTDTFQICTLRRRDSLSWLAGRGTVEERTPFHMVSRNGALEVQERVICVRSFGDIAWPGLLGHPTSLYQIFPCGGS